MQNQPNPGPVQAVNAAELRRALQGGQQALRALIEGSAEQNLTRNQRLERARGVIQLLPTLQLSVEQRQLLIRVTRQVLWQLSEDVARESQNQVGERLAKLQAEQKEIIAAREAAQKQEEQNQPTAPQQPSAPATAPRGLFETLWQQFQSTTPGRQALAVGAVAAAGAALVWLWTKMKTWMKVTVLGVAGFFGLPRLIEYIRRNRGAPIMTPRRPASPHPSNPVQNAPPGTVSPSPPAASPETPPSDFTVLAGPLRDLPGWRAVALQTEQALWSFDRQPTQQRLNASQAAVKVEEEVLRKNFAGSTPERIEQMVNRMRALQASLERAQWELRANLSEAALRQRDRVTDSTSAFQSNPNRQRLQALLEHSAQELEAIGRENVTSPRAFERLIIPRVDAILSLELESVETALRLGVLPSSGRLPQVALKLRARRTAVLAALRTCNAASYGQARQSCREARAAFTLPGTDDERINRVIRAMSNVDGGLDTLLRQAWRMQNATDPPAS